MRRGRRIQKDDLKKGIYILPNLFTSASLFAGFYSIVALVIDESTNEILSRHDGAASFQMLNRFSYTTWAATVITGKWDIVE